MAMPVFPTATATFINGLTPESFANGGHRTVFEPSLDATLTLAQYAAAAGEEIEDIAAQVAADAASAAAGSGTEASVANLRAGTSAQYMSIRRAYEAQVPVVLTDAASIAWNMASGINFAVTLGGATRTLANPSGQVAGKSGLLIIKQDATGGRAITTWGSNFIWIGNPPVFPTVAAKRTLVSYFVEADGSVLLNFGGNQP